MSSPQIKIGVGIDGAAFQRGMSAIMGQVGELKGALLAGLGIGAFSAIISSAIEFGNNIAKASEELDVTIDRAVQLSRIMESVGRNTNTLVTAFAHAREYMKGAFDSAEKMANLKSYGITPGMQSNGHYGFSGDMDMIMKTMLISSQTRGPGAGIGNSMMFRNMYGKPGDDILYKKDQILQNPEDSGIRKEELRQITELTSQFKILKEALSILVLQAIMPFANYILRFLAGSKDTTDTDVARQVRGLDLYYKKHGKYPEEVSPTQSKILSAQQELAMLSNFMHPGTPITSGIREGYLRRSLELAIPDADIRKQVIKEIPTKNDHIKELEKRMAALFNSPPPATIEPPAYKREFESNSFTKVGGLLGVDTSYRLSVLQVAQQQLDVSKDMAATLRSIDAKTMGAAMSVGAASSPFASMMVSTLASQADADSKPRTGSGPKGITWPNRAAERAAVLKASAAL